MLNRGVKENKHQLLNNKQFSYHFQHNYRISTQKNPDRMGVK